MPEIYFPFKVIWIPISLSFIMPIWVVNHVPLSVTMLV